jgi:hypothetical protein
MEYLKRMTGLEVANGAPQTFIGVGIVVVAALFIARGIGRLIGRPVRA